jgi:hypothetical protein
MKGRAEPELELVRKATPFGLPAAILAFGIGSVAGGWGTGWSAALGVVVVTLNFAASGVSMSRAATISLMALAATGMVGWIVRLTIIVGLLFFLQSFSWFSPLAFGLAVVPATVLLIAYEMKLIAGGVGQQLVLPPVDREEVAQ